MLEGIEILSQKVVETNTPIPIFLCLIVSVMTALVILVTVLTIIEKDWIVVILLGVFSIVEIILTSAFWYDHFTAKPKCYTEYKVICSDTVNFNEFNQKYEILEQEGKIYTIREREVSD